MMSEYQAHPLRTILDQHGNPYVSVIDMGKCIRVQIHKQGDLHPIFVNMDKRALPELIEILKEFV
jgi:hypothetical protein